MPAPIRFDPHRPRSLHVPGHFGEWIQGRGADGTLALVSVPAPHLGVRGWRIPAPGGLAIHGAAGLSPARARRFLASLGLRLSGRVVLRPLAAAGLGTGVSTAALVALARLAGFRGPATALASALIAAEGASDPLFLPATPLWAAREGRVLAQLAPPPRFWLLGGYLGAAQRTDPGDTDFPEIADLIAAWPRAGGRLRLAALANLASESAARSTARRGPSYDPMADLAAQTGALGWLRAHTGAARGLIFAPSALPRSAPDLLREAGLRGVHLIRGGIGGAP